MKNHNFNSFSVLRPNFAGRQAGFSLLELLAAMAVFMVIGGAAVTLFRRHVPLFTAQQSQTAVNISARNAAAEMQMDLVNAGNGFYQGANIPNLPVGISILPSATFGTCNPGTTQNYTAACFDTLSIITVDTSASPVNATGSGANTTETVSSSTLYATVPAGSSFTAAQIAAQYKQGDEILLVNVSGSQIAVAVLTANPTVSGTKIVFQHSTSANYTDTISGQTYQDDYYNLVNTISNNHAVGSSSDLYAGAADNNYSFGQNDWILKLNGTTYGISLANPADPTLVRSQDNGTPQVVADQVIGFRIGGYALLNTGAGPQWNYDTTSYNLNSTTAVRISLIGRTNPLTGTADAYRNTFDGGPYRVEGISIVVDPRNLSM